MDAYAFKTHKRFTPRARPQKMERLRQQVERQNGGQQYFYCKGQALVRQPAVPFSIVFHKPDLFSAALDGNLRFSQRVNAEEIVFAGRFNKRSGPPRYPSSKSTANSNTANVRGNRWPHRRARTTPSGTLLSRARRTASSSEESATIAVKSRYRNPRARSNARSTGLWPYR